MKLGLKVKFVDGTEKRIDAVFADFVAFERTWQRSVAKFEHDLRLTDLAWLAWNNETRKKQTSLKFDPDYVETIDSVELSDDDSPGDIPLEKTPQVG